MDHVSDVAQRPVRVVIDSACDVPEPLVNELNITVVPLTVSFGDETFIDGVEMTARQFMERLMSSPVFPTTSQPSPGAFEAAFRKLVDAGHDVVCVTIASKLSGTNNSARLAASAVAPERIAVIDSETVTVAAGWVAIAAAQAARQGASKSEVVAAAEDAKGRVQLYAVLDTLEYLQKGGRMGRAAMLLGSVLSIKPIVTVRDGEVVPVERVRTRKKAIERLASLGESMAPMEGLAVLYSGSRDDAEKMAERLAPLVPSGNIIFSEVGPVVAAYAGPNAVGVIGLSARG